MYNVNSEWEKCTRIPTFFKVVPSEVPKKSRDEVKSTNVGVNREKNYEYRNCRVCWKIYGAAHPRVQDMKEQGETEPSCCNENFQWLEIDCCGT